MSSAPAISRTLGAERVLVPGRGYARAALGAAILGAVVSAYLTITHVRAADLVCTQGGIVDCGAVTSSVYSVVGSTGIPVALLGVAWFAVSGALALAVLRSTPAPGWLVPAHLGWAVLGLAYVVFLVWAEFVAIHRLCEWCTLVHLLVLVTFVAAFRRVQLLA